MEHICVILDVGNHMVVDDDNEISNSTAYLSVEALIQKKFFSETKDEVSLIYCGTEDTNNPLYSIDSDAFKHISIISNIGVVNWDLLQKLKEEIRTCEDDNADLLEAIYIAADHLVNKLQGRQKLGKKRIFLFSNLDCEIELSQIDMVIEGLEKETIEFNIVTNRLLSESNVNDLLSEKSTNFHQKLSEIKLLNEQELQKLVVITKGNCFSFKEALKMLNVFDVKSIHQRGWKVNLQISDVFSLSLVGHLKVKPVRPAPLKVVYGGDPEADIDTNIRFFTNDTEQISMEDEDLIKGFKYGKSIIPCTDEDIESMKLTVEKSLKLIGFTEKENVPHSLLIGEGSMFFVVDQENHSAAFTSLVYAMYSLGVVALARRVYSKASSPKLAVLIPWIKIDHVSLVYSEIAFGEDIRSYTFPSFFKSDKLSSKLVTFTDKQISVVDELIDQMMLVEMDDKCNEQELYKPSTIRNPAIQYYYQCAQHRYFKPDKNLPELSEDILSTLKPPVDKMLLIQDVIDSIKENFPLKTKSNTSKKKHLDEILSEDEKLRLNKKSKLNSEDCTMLNDLLVNKVTGVGSVNPVSDFLVLLSLGQITNAVSEMENRIWQLVNDSYLTTFYNKAISCLQELRKQSIKYSNEEMNLVDKFNQFLDNMNTILNVNSAKKDFLNLVIQENILPISENESKYSSLITGSKKCLQENPDVFSDMNSDDDFLFDDM